MERRWQPTRLRVTIGALLALLVVGAAAARIDTLLDDGHVRVNQEYLKVAVEDRHVVIEQFLNERLSLLKLLARTTPVPALTTQTHAETLLGELASTYRDYQSVSTYTREGRRLSLAGEDSAPAEAADAAWFVATVGDGDYVSALELGPHDIPTLAMAVLATTPGGDTVVRATLNLATLNAHLAEMVSGASGGTYMVDPITGAFLSRPYFGGQPLTQTSPEFSWGRKHFHVDYREHGIEEVDAGRHVRADGTEVIEAHCCTRDGTWLVVVEREIDEVHAQNDALKLQLGVTLLLALAALAAIAVGVVRAGRG